MNSYSSKFLCIACLFGLVQPLPAQVLEEEWQFIPSNPTALIAESIILDGRPLFRVTAPEGGDNALSLKQRIKEIDRNLQRVISSGIDPDRLAVAVEIDTVSNQPVIYVNNQYVMTVTSLDAQLQNQSPEMWAQEVKRILREALLNYYDERQPQSFMQKTFILSSLVIVLILSNFLIRRYQRKLQTKRSELEAELNALHLKEVHTEEEIAAIAQEKLMIQRQIATIGSKQWLLFLLQASLWSAFIIISLGIFPQSRHIQLVIIIALQGTVSRLLFVIFGVFVLSRLSEQTIDRLFLSMSLGPWWNSSQRVKRRLDTFTGIAKGLANVIVVTIGLILSLVFVGVNIAPVIASLGFIGLGISLAGQDLIKDMINGILILLEDQYAEGDMIAVNGKTGQVERITLRITQLRNTEGALITIPNREVKMVENLSNGWARVDMTIDVAYNTDLDRAMAVLVAVAEQMSREWIWRQKILDSPELQGVDNFGNNSIGLRIWIKVQPLQQWAVAREYRRRLKLAFDREGISMPFPQRSIWFENSLSIAKIVKED